MTMWGTTKIEFSDLVALLGERDALRLCRRFPSQYLPSAREILREKRNRAIWRDYRKGAQIGELAAKYSMPPARIRAMITKLRQQEKDSEEKHG
jgi:hypothetical protein